MASAPNKDNRWANQGAIARGVFSRIVQQEMGNPALHRAQAALAKELGKNPAELVAGDPVADPAALKVEADQAGGDLRLPRYDFMSGTTWGEILRANQGGPIADYSPG